MKEAFYYVENDRALEHGKREAVWKEGKWVCVQTRTAAYFSLF
jgi:hypothetical protein